MKGHLVILLSIVLCGCATDPEVLARRSAAIKDFIGYDSLVCVSEWRRKCVDANIQSAAERDDVENISKGAGHIRQLIKDRLALVPHSYADLPMPLSEQSCSVDKLHPEQVLLVYFLLNDLENTSLFRHISRAVKNISDTEYLEIGGLLVFDDGDLVFSPQPNEAETNPLLALMREFTGGAYRFSNEVTLRNFAFLFHSHVRTERSQLPAGPSWNIRRTKDGQRMLDMDLSAIFYTLIEHGSAHHLVITKMPRRQINIDYAGAVLTTAKPVPPENSGPITQLRSLVTLDLGIYQY